MRKLFLIAATSITICIAPLALAADNQFYFKVQAGTSILNKTKDKLFNMKIKSKPKGVFGLGVGYHVMENIRTDVTLDFLVHPQLKKSFNQGGTESSIKHTGQVTSLLVNGYVDIFDLTVVKFFGGAGLGWAQVKEKIHSYIGGVKKVEGTTKKANNLAYQLTVGASTALVGGVAAELAYSWRDYGQTKKAKDRNVVGKTSYKSHSLTLGLRLDI